MILAHRESLASLVPARGSSASRRLVLHGWLSSRSPGHCHRLLEASEHGSRQSLPVHAQWTIRVPAWSTGQNMYILSSWGCRRVWKRWHGCFFVVLVVSDLALATAFFGNQTFTTKRFWLLEDRQNGLKTWVAKRTEKGPVSCAYWVDGLCM